VTKRLCSARLKIFVAAAVVLGPFAYAADSSTNISLKTTKAELAETLKELNALDVWLTQAEKQRAQWQQELQRSDREVARLGLKVAELQDAAKASASTQAELAREAVTLAQQREYAGKRIAEHLNAAYRMSDHDFFKLLLNQETPEQFDRMIRYHDYFSAERGKVLQGYRQTLAAIELNQAKAAATQEALHNQQTAAKEQQRAFIAQQSERKQLIAKLASNVRSKQAQQTKLQQDSKRLRTLLQQLSRRSQQNPQQRAQQKDGQEFADRKGKLAWPTRGRLQNGFGEPRAEGRLKWQGSYIVTDPGSIIRAVHRGKVIFAEWLRGFGLLTIVDHGNGYLSLYGYADVLLKEPGDRVESGEQIANSGRSGGQDTDGLYFELRKDGRPINPTQWLFTSPTE